MQGTKRDRLVGATIVFLTEYVYDDLKICDFYNR